MRSFEQIHASYLATEGFLAQSEHSVASQRAKARWSKLRFYNDQAYYAASYNKLDQYYDLRCAVAHGTSLAHGTIVIPIAVQDFRKFAKNLK